MSKNQLYLAKPALPRESHEMLTELMFQKIGYKLTEDFPGSMPQQLMLTQ